MGDKPAEAVFNSLISKTSGDRRIAALNIPKVLAAAMAARQKLLDTADEVEDWTAEVYDANRNESEGCIAKYQECFQTLLLYKISLDTASQDISSKSTEDNKRVRERQRAIQAKLVKGKCPDSLAKFVASVLEQRKGDAWTTAKYVDGSGGSHGPASQITENCEFSVPGALLASVQNEKNLDLSWHTQFQEQLQTVKEAREKKNNGP